jgi:catechol 2,3-dioxygenase-like lactoylglutathione lyase family enzyme
VFSHVDLRVRDRAKAVAFYDAIFGALGLERSDGENWTTYGPVGDDPEADGATWFGFTVDPGMTPGSTRIALAAATCEEVDRATTVAMATGAAHIEGPDYAYGPQYYAVFFDDPDGNRLEICCFGPRARAAS